MFDLFSSSPQLPFGTWMPCSSIAYTWSVTAVHRTHRMQLPPENASLEWWRAHLHETTRVQSPDKVQSPWLKCRLFPCLLMYLCCFVWLARRVLEGLQWKEAGCSWLNNSPVDLPVPMQLERLAETLTCCESQVVVLWCSQVLPGWELTPHEIPFWAGGAIPSMLCSDTSQEWITSLRGAFPGSFKRLSTTTKPIRLLWCRIRCSSLVFIFSLREKGSLFGWEGNKLLDEYK